ncbi:ABC transporter ATP-binding protein [Malacoplasma muris]|uniref:ABC transporter ATP-binding protein n=1 Tax=Malacoplasma muris TaxID=2119 RepID=UPI00398E67CA
MENNKVVNQKDTSNTNHLIKKNNVDNDKTKKNIPENKNTKLSQLINQMEWLYKQIQDINTQIDINKENATNKVLISKQNKLYRALNSKISKAERLVSNDKYSSLPPDIAISLTNVTKYYSSKTFALKVLDNINLNIYKGDFVVILGPSGSGKTSLMNLLSGIDVPTYGDVNVEGFKLQNLTSRQLTSFRKDVISYVFQRYGLLPNLTVYENVLMGSFLGKNTYSEKVFQQEKNFNALTELKEKERCLKILEIMGLLSQKEKYPYEMSGGQKQRTSIARTMAKNPLIIFGDEPTGAVDEEMSQNIIDAFVKINQELKTTIIIITHDEKISTFANRVIFVLDGKINNVVCKQKGVKL